MPEGADACADAARSETVLSPATEQRPAEPVVVRTSEDLAVALADVLAAERPLVAFDTETWGDPEQAAPCRHASPALDPLAARIRLAQFTAGGAIYVADCAQVDPRELQPLLDHATLIGHNLKYELRVLLTTGLNLPDELGHRLIDTMLASQVLDAGATDLNGTAPRSGYHRLDTVLKRHLGVEVDKSEQASDWSGKLRSEQLHYAASDVQHLLPLARALHNALAEAGLTETALLEYRTLPALAWLEQSGAPFDDERWTQLARQAEERKAELAGEMNTLVGDRPSRTPLDLGPVSSALVCWDSPEQVREVLADRGVDLPDTEDRTLTSNAGRDPLIALLLEYRKAAKLAGTYGHELARQHRHPVDGRIHADYFQLGAATGRMSCRAPNLQQVPNEEAYRACFRAPEGRCLVWADYSQIEVRVAAEMTGDEHLLQAFERGEDIYATVGKRLGVDRKAAKTIVLGAVYGLGGRGLRDRLSASGIEVDEQEARQQLDRFWAAFPTLNRWRNSIPRDEPADTRTLLGRRRLGVATYTQKVNTPIQGTACDIFKLALAALMEQRPQAPPFVPVLAVHDELVLECGEEDADQLAGWLERCMRDAASEVLKRVPVDVEVETARSWAGGDT